MSRNKNRTGATMPDAGPPPDIYQGNAESDFSFIVPTEFVELPSKGKFYAAEHPLHGQDTIELKQMTAKHEDMLTSRTLIKKGVVLDRVIQSLIVDRRIDAQSLLTGDRNAILIAARVSAYGNIYTTQVGCPACSTKQEYSFDLNDADVYESNIEEGEYLVDNGNGTFTTTLPRTQVSVIFKILTGYDEKRFSDKYLGKKSKDDQIVTDYLRSILVQVNDHTSKEAIEYVVQNIPSADARFLRSISRAATPNIDLTQHFECEQCDFEGDMEVPLNADFFWPDR